VKDIATSIGYKPLPRDRFHHREEDHGAGHRRAKAGRSRLRISKRRGSQPSR
jgi:hypothetical protein